MKNKGVFLLCAVCLTMTACGKAANNEQESLTEGITTISEITEIEKVSVTSKSETTTTAPTETTVITTTRPTPETTFDESDEILVRGQKFAESYAEMYWNYFEGAAWFDKDIQYYDLNDKSEENYFEYNGMPFYKLLITDYTYDELIAYIKSFYSDELFEVFKENSLIDVLFTGRDNCIYVNGNEPVLMYHLRNEHAHIIGYTESGDGSVTYDCFAKTTEEDDDDLYFSFTLNTDGKLCGDFDISLENELGLFSDKYYNDTPMVSWGNDDKT